MALVYVSSDTVTCRILTAYDSGRSRFSHCTVTPNNAKLVFIMAVVNKDLNAAVERDEDEEQRGGTS